MARGMVAVAVAAALLAAACSADGADTDGGVVIREGDEPAVAQAPTIPGEPSAQIIREERVYLLPAPLMALQKEHGVAPVILAPDTYTVDAFGTPLTIQLNDYWRLEAEWPAYIQLTRPDAELDALLPAVTFHRAVGFADPAIAGTGPIGSGPVGWTWDDLEEWIEAMPQLVVLGEGSLMADGRTIRWWDIDVDPTLGPTNTNCQPGTCVAAWWSGAHTHSVARDLERIRWYEIEDPFEPWIVFVSTAEDEFETFTTAIDIMLQTATFGDPAPSPLPDRVAQASRLDIPANETWQVAGIDGLTITSQNFAIVNQRVGEVRAWRVGRADPEAVNSVIKPHSLVTGEALESVAAVEAAILDNAEEVTRLPDEEVFGLPATAFEITHSGAGFILLREPYEDYDTTFAEWPDMTHSLVWVVDSPIGPLIVNASGPTDFHFDRALETIDWFVSIVGFCDGPTESCSGRR